MLVLKIEHESSVYIGDMKVTVLLPDDSDAEEVYLQVHLEYDELLPEVTVDVP